MRLQVSAVTTCTIGPMMLWCLLLAPALAAGQSPRAPSSPSTTWSPPRTPDGHVDLQGVWLNNSATPLERPPSLAGRTRLTDDEVEELQRRADRLRQNGSDFAPGDSFFLAVLADVEKYSTPNATGDFNENADRVFDNRTSLIVDPPDGRMPARTTEGQERAAAAQRKALGTMPDGPEDVANYNRCIAFGVPRIGGNSADNSGYLQVVQTRDSIVLLNEQNHEARIVPSNGGPHLPSSVRRWNGDSRGRWDGDTLVIDTTNFSSKSMFQGAADGLHLTERFSRVAPGRLDYEITIDDPTTWVRPWTALLWLKESADLIYEYACHEGNYDVMRGILGGARFEERSGGVR